MKTKAQFRGHPIHPMLIPFPIAFLTGAAGADLVGKIFSSPPWWTMGAYLSIAGIIAALVAAVPGFIDFLFAVPPKSSASKRAVWHLSVNLSAVALFAVAWLVRGPAAAPPPVVTIILELAGLGLMSAGGWMGGTLAYRNFIGPDHRFANTAKWQEESFRGDSGDTITVAQAKDLKDDQTKLVRVNGQRIVVARTAGKVVSFCDHCTHRGASLADGVLIDGKLQCLWHGSRFDVCSGRVLCGPAKKDIDTYTVAEVDGEIRLTLPPRTE